MKIHKINISQTIAVAYIARGADKYWLISCERFLRSYIENPAGISHALYIIFKGFSSAEDLADARLIFDCVKYVPIFLADENFDIGAYIEWANSINEELICPLNSGTQILSHDWLYKLAINLSEPNVGLVGATASYESLKDLNSLFPPFRNIHIRSTGFMIKRKLFCELTLSMPMRSKIDAYQFESGRKSLTKMVVGKRLNVLLVGRNGRGYAPKNWINSQTFRQGSQSNLLIGDNQTRNYLALTWSEKRDCVLRAWGLNR